MHLIQERKDIEIIPHRLPMLYIREYKRSWRAKQTNIQPMMSQNKRN